MVLRNIIARLVSFAILLTLAACGTRVDTPPTVASLSPGVGNQNVLLREPFQVTFLSAIDQRTLDSLEVTVTDGSGASYATVLSLSADRKTLQIELADLPSVPNTLTVELSYGINGSALKLPQDQWTFEVPGWVALGEALSVADGATHGSAPAIAVDADGALGVAWVENDGTTTNAYVATWGGADWEAMQLVSSGSWAAAAPSLALNGQGYPTVVWTESTGAGTNAYARSRSGATWSAAELLSSTTLAPDTDVEINENGEPLVTWIGPGPLGYQIFVRRKIGTSWEDLGTLTGPMIGSAFEPTLALDASGEPTVAWQHFDPAMCMGSCIYTAQYEGATWTPAETVGGFIIGSVSNPTLAIDADGDLLVAWQGFDPALQPSIMFRRKQGTVWQTAEALTPNLGSLSRTGPSLAVDGTDPVIAWSESDGTTTNIYVKRKNGSGWEQLGLLSANAGATNATEPSLALDPWGNPVVAWTESDGEATKIYVQRYNQ